VDYAPEDIKKAEGMLQKANSNKDIVSGSSVASRQLMLKFQSKGLSGIILIFDHVDTCSY
jgi:hypothetical protein